MCVIMACEKDFPSLETLKDAELFNKDGAGIAWVNNNQVEWLKGLKAKELYDFIQDGKIKTPCVIHFRKASAGSKSLHLCHPFAIGDQKENPLYGKANAVLFHNGHITNYEKYMKMIKKTTKENFNKYMWSDSRLMAYMLYHYGGSFLRVLLENTVTSQKVAILTSSGITRLGTGWVNHDNVICSNIDFDPSNVYYCGGFGGIYYKEYPILTKYQRELKERRGSVKEGMSQLFENDKELSLNHISAKKAMELDKGLDQSAETRYNFWGM